MEIATIMASNRQMLTKVEQEYALLLKDQTQLELEKANLDRDKQDSVSTMDRTQKMPPITAGTWKSGGQKSTRPGWTAISTFSVLSS